MYFLFEFDKGFISHIGYLRSRSKQHSSLLVWFIYHLNYLVFIYFNDALSQSRGCYLEVVNVFMEGALFRLKEIGLVSNDTDRQTEDGTW